MKHLAGNRNNNNNKLSEFVTRKPSEFIHDCMTSPNNGNIRTTPSDVICPPTDEFFMTSLTIEIPSSAH